MDHFEMAEKLTAKANITLEEAKKVLEDCNWDILEAMIRLEKDGKTKELSGNASTVKGEKRCEEVLPSVLPQQPHDKSSKTHKFRDWIRSVFRKGMDNQFVVKKDNRVVLSLPALVFFILAVSLFWISLIVLLAGVAFGYKYSFSGKDLGTEGVNRSVEKFEDFASDITDKVKEGIQKHKSEHENNCQNRQ